MVLTDKSGLSLSMKDKIQKIRTEQVFNNQIADLLTKWLQYLGITNGDLVSFYNKIKGLFLSDKSIYAIEEELHKFFYSSNFTVEINDRLRVEEELVFSEIKDLFLPGSCLDIGCGSGLIAKKVSASGHAMQLVDVIDFNKTDLPSDIYDGEKLPYQDGSFENVSLLTVLHHCNNPRTILKEAIRVARSRLIIIESVYVKDSEFLSNMFFDWMWNRVVYQDVNVPFNFLSPAKWEETFKKENLKIKHQLDLGYDSPMTPEHHWLFVLDKKA